jgi:hypothetical protein
MPSALSFPVAILKIAVLCATVATLWPAIATGMLAPLMHGLTEISQGSYSWWVDAIYASMFLLGTGGAIGLISLAIVEGASLRGTRPTGLARTALQVGISWGTLAASCFLAITWYPTDGQTRQVTIEDLALLSCVLIAVQALWRLREA